MSLLIFFPFSLLASYGFSFLVPKTSRHWFVLEMILIHLLGVAFAFYTFPIPEKLDFGLLYWPFFNFPPPHFLRGFWGAIIISLYALGRALSYRYFTITPDGQIVRRREHPSSAFTLIELLVVIAIIGLLSSIVFASLNSAREKARVARAAADLKEITKALAMHYDDNNNYPCFDHNWDDARERSWAAPYYQWPKNPWGTEYHWEHGQRGFTYSISLRAIGQSAAQALDTAMDDGNLATGIIRGDGNRLEYGGMDQTAPSTHCH